MLRKSYFLYGLIFFLDVLMAPSIPSARIPPPGELSGILQLCPPQGGAFAATGQPGVGALSKAISVFSILKDVHVSLFILNFLSVPNMEILERVDKPDPHVPPTHMGNFIWN